MAFAAPVHGTFLDFESRHRSDTGSVGRNVMQQDGWKQEMRDAMRLEAWSLAGPNRIVKVVPASRPMAFALKGFVCLERSLVGKTPVAIEAALGLPAGHLFGGCRVYRFRRLPMSFEVEYELTAEHPNGLAFNPAMHDSAYPRGDGAIHQWRLLADVPVELLIDLPPTSRFPYLHG
jgi:hypothetical protein